jgi:hypothetical protein
MVAVLCCSAGAGVGQPSANRAMNVEELRATAALVGDQIRVRLPLTAPAETRGTVSVWLLSPTGEASPAVTQSIAPGIKIVEAEIPCPRDKKGIAVESVEWYRVSYRTNAPYASETHGILALGALTTNLFHLSVARPSGYLTPGKALAVRAFAGNPVTQRPSHGVHVIADLEIDLPEKKQPQMLTRSGEVNRSGEVFFQFPIPDVAGVSATLHLKGVLRGGNGELATSTLDSEFEAMRQAYISLEKDKALYQPGQTVHLRALVFDGRSRAAGNVPVTMTIDNADGKKVLAEVLTTNRFGIAAYDWKLSDQTETGNYEVEVEAGDKTELDGKGRMTVPVERYDLPEFTVNAELDQGYYLEGQTPEVKIRAGYLFGKPVASGSVRLVRDADEEWDPETGKRKETADPGEKAALDHDGNAVFHLGLQKEFKSIQDASYMRYRDLTFRAYVTDATTGRTEPRKFSLRISRDPIHIYLRELGGNDREGDYLVMTSYADGVPAACKVTLDAIVKDALPERIAAVATDRYGLGKVHLRFPGTSKDRNSIDLRITAHDAKGLTGRFDDTESSYAGSDAIWIDVEKSLLAPREPIRAVVHGPVGKLVDLDVLGDGAVLRHLQEVLKDGTAALLIPADERFHGLIALDAYSVRDRASDAYVNRSSKNVLYPEDTELRFRVTGLKAKYAPDEEVHASFRVTDPKGGVETAVGVGVTDAAVGVRARTEEDFDERSWGWGAWYEEHREIAGLTLDDLNRIDMAQPVPDDLQLAAEALLQESYGSNISVESQDDSDIRNQYEETMEEALKPLGAALLDAKPEHLTNDVDKIAAAAKQAKLGNGILLDPWNVPYHPQVETESDQEVLQFLSAGPDKKFGTADDFTIDVARQSIFARAGERLQGLLQTAVSRDEPLPGTVDALFDFAKQRSFDLAALRDPQGRPFVFQVRVERRWLSVSARMLQEGENPKAPEEQRFEIPMWTSSMFNYIAPVENELHAAIRAWIEAGHTFPISDEEARQAFSAAGIRFDNLRDPTGQPYSIRTEEVVSFTRSEEVHAGTQLAVTVKPVTMKMRAIEILRPSTTDKSGQAEIAATFLEPYEQQSGQDMKPNAIEGDTFRGDTGAVGGTVTDQTGAVIPNATIVVKSGMIEQEISSKSDATGGFVIGNLEPGFYNVEVSAAGFMSMSFEGVEVSSAALTTVNVTLSVGNVSETVAVSAAPSRLETSSAQTAANDRDPTAARTFRTPAGTMVIMQQDVTPRLRHVFEETAFWTPSLETDATGRAALHFTLPDSLTTWKLHAVASTVNGRMQSLDSSFVAFQPFFVDLNAPQVLTVGDELTLPVDLRNYTTNLLKLPTTIANQPWMEALTAQTVQTSVPENGTAAVSFGMRAARPIDHGLLRISSANRVTGDAVEKEIRVHPDGQPQTLASTALLHDKEGALELDLPESAIPGSIHARLRVYPNLATHIAEGIDALIAQPHGCAEQTISSTYPSLLLLSLLKATGDRSGLQDRAQKYLRQGYESLLDYYEEGGGLTYWGGSDHHADAALTAYSLEFLDDAAPFISIRPSTLSAARNWLLDSQLSDGSWKAYYGKADPRSNLYIAMQLQRSLALDAPAADRDRTRLAVDRAIEWAGRFVPAVHDPFSNALRLQIAVLRKQPIEQERLVTELESTILRDRRGTYWNVDGALPFYTWGYAGSLETTAVTLQSLLTTNINEDDRRLVDSAVLYLIDTQDAGGIWYSGQTTVRVLKALLPFAVAQLKTAPADSPLQVRINGKLLSVDDDTVLQANKQLLDAPETLDVTAYVKPGHNEIQFATNTGSEFASAQLASTFYTPWAQLRKDSGTQTGKDYGLDFDYRCEADSAVAGKPISCNVDARRFGSSGYGMLLAEIGLPPGAEVDREQLTKLQADGSISRYEIEPDHITFYFWASGATGTRFTFQFTPRFAIRAKAAPSSLFDYYNPDERVVLVPQLFEVPAPKQVH